MTATNQLSGHKLSTLAFGDVAPHRAVNKGQGYTKKDLRDHLYKSVAVPNPLANHMSGHWNGSDHTTLFSTKEDQIDAGKRYGGERYGDGIYADPNTGELMFKWGGNATSYANGSYHCFLRDNSWPVYLYTRVRTPDAFILFGRLQMVSWEEQNRNGERLPVVTFRLVDAPANAAVAYPQLLA